MDVRDWDDAGFVVHLRDFQRMVYQSAVDHGFWNGPENFGLKVALIHSEASELLEKWRKTAAKALALPPDEHCPGYNGLEIEICDIIIRCLDLAEHYGFDIGAGLVAKARYNAGREYLHGKGC